MTYRDADDEARRAQFENEKRALEARIAELEAANAALLTGERSVEKLFGVPMTIVATAKSDGVLERKALMRLVRGIDPIVGDPGEQTFGHGLGVWRSHARDLRVVVRHEGDAMTIRVSERIGLVTGAMVGGVLGGAGGVTALAAVLYVNLWRGEPILLLAIPVWLLLMYGVARLVLWRHARSRQRKVDDIALRLAERLPGSREAEPDVAKPS